MKIHEIHLTVGKRYKCSDGQVYEVVRCHGNADLEDVATRSSITDMYYLSKILTLDFDEAEKAIDWTKVEVDTKIEVRDMDNQGWLPRYFARCDKETGGVYAWFDGGTSYTTKNVLYWGEARLYKED